MMVMREVALSDVESKHAKALVLIELRSFMTEATERALRFNA